MCSALHLKAYKPIFGQLISKAYALVHACMQACAIVDPYTWPSLHKDELGKVQFDKIRCLQTVHNTAAFKAGHSYQY